VGLFGVHADIHDHSSVVWKLSDLYGRRRLYAIAIALFLIGSVWCGLANSMDQLIFARALQGIGAGGIVPLAFILIGEMFSLEQRTKMQGLFSGVWGVSSIVGPLLAVFSWINFHGVGSFISTSRLGCWRRHSSCLRIAIKFTATESRQWITQAQAC